MNSTKNIGHRERASSLRTQMFNKYLFNKMIYRWKNFDILKDIELSGLS